MPLLPLDNNQSKRQKKKTLINILSRLGALTTVGQRLNEYNSSEFKSEKEINYFYVCIALGAPTGLSIGNKYKCSNDKNPYEILTTKMY